MDPTLLSLLAGSLVALLVRVISNARVNAIQGEADRIREELYKHREEMIRLERERYRLRIELARHGIDADKLTPLPDDDPAQATHHALTEERRQ
jgi:hypothetical protein